MKAVAPEAVELRLAMLLQGFADHFGGELRFHVAQAFNGLLAILDLARISPLAIFSQLLLQLDLLQIALEFVALLYRPVRGPP